MKAKKKVKKGWFAMTMADVMGQKVTGFRYRKAGMKQAGKKVDLITLRFPNGTLTIAPDLVGKDVELVAWFSSK